MRRRRRRAAPLKSGIERIWKMRLGSLRSSSRDGELAVVSEDSQKMALAKGIAGSLREAVENWEAVRPRLEELSQKLSAGQAEALPLDESRFLSPLPRAFQWIDGSAFIQHIRLVRKSRGAPLPETLTTVPLVYQGAGDSFLAPREDIPQIDPAHGTDFEGEFGVIVNDTPMGIGPEEALKHVILLVLINDISLRGLAKEELKRGFGFVQSKPSSAFAPFAATADELGGSWRGGRVHLPLLVHFNGREFGKASGAAMHFHFGELIAHAARTRRLSAGTIVGSGTVSSEDPSMGSSCLVEKRTLEQIETGKARQPFMRPGDHVEIKALDSRGKNIFGAISQKAAAAR